MTTRDNSYDDEFELLNATAADGGGADDEELEELRSCRSDYDGYAPVAASKRNGGGGGLLNSVSMV